MLQSPLRRTTSLCLFKWLWLLLAMALFGATSNPAWSQDDELLEPAKAFQLSAEAVAPDRIRLEYQIAEGYYLYRSKLRFSSQSAGITLQPAEMPDGIVKQDEFFGEMEIYRHRLPIEIPLERESTSSDTLTLKAKSQGCADIGVCYPPQTHTLNIALPERAIAEETFAAPLIGSADPFATTRSEVGGGFPEPADRSLADDPFGLSLNESSDPDELLEPDLAFIPSVELIEEERLAIRWRIADGYYLYRNKLTARSETEGVTLGKLDLPTGNVIEDDYFGTMEVYYHVVDGQTAITRASPGGDAIELVVELGYQGCAEIGVCYPPQNKQFAVQLPSITQLAAERRSDDPSTSVTATTAGKEIVVDSLTLNAQSSTEATQPEQDRFANLLASGGTWGIVGAFFVAGLLLAFTPCIFPMVPILSGIIIGQGEGLTTRRAFLLSLVYVLAMAITYSIAGVVTGLAGENLQAAFQNPWILSAFAALFVALALSMFGFYELQIPSSLQAKLSEISNSQQGGTLIGVAIMGLLSALIVGPCVAAPLVGALIYIGQSGDPFLGGLALFALGLGMGLPLLAIGTSAGALLPKAGAWMDAVKALFGVLLLAVGIWLLERILPEVITMLLWASLLIISSIYLGALEPIPEGASGWRRLWKGLGVIMLLYGAMQLVGVAANGRDWLQPLRGISSTGAVNSESGELHFTQVKGVEGLERELESARSQSQPVMLDFYADWCISCKEMERYTFSDPGVQRSLTGYRILQSDVTANDDQDKALLASLGLFGPPAILFYDREGEEQKNYRVVGFMEAEQFRRHVEAQRSEQ